MSTLLKPLLVRETLLQKRVSIFNHRDLERIFHARASQTKYFLEAYTRAGLFVRLKKGLYALKSDLPSEEEIANWLYRPSYISFEYALGRFSIIPEMAYAVTSATTKPTRTFQVEDKTFVYLTIKPTAFAGYLPTPQTGRVVLIAEPEKALVDYLYFVALGKKSLNDRLNLTRLDRQKIWEYARLYQRPGLEKLLREILC
jgi:predicted transcriptional regulator of viral defense system